MLSCVCCDCIWCPISATVIGSHREMWTVVKLKWLQGSKWNPQHGAQTHKEEVCVIAVTCLHQGTGNFSTDEWQTAFFRAAVVVVAVGFSSNPYRWVWPVCGTWCKWLNNHTSRKDFTISSKSTPPPVSVVPAISAWFIQFNAGGQSLLFLTEPSVHSRGTGLWQHHW